MLPETLLYLREEMLGKISRKQILLDVGTYGRLNGRLFTVYAYPSIEAVDWHPWTKWTRYKPVGKPIRIGIVRALSRTEALYYARNWAKANRITYRQIAVKPYGT